MSRELIRGTSFSILLLLLCVGVLGCTQVIKPDYVAPIREAGTNPLPLRVHLNVVHEDLEGGFQPMGVKLAARLIASNLFTAVDYAAESEHETDLSLKASFKARFVADPWENVKKAAEGLAAIGASNMYLLPLAVPFVLTPRYESRYLAKVDLEIVKREQQLKTYSAESEIVVKHKVSIADTKSHQEAIAAATEHLLNQLVDQLLNDRAFFAGLP